MFPGVPHIGYTDLNLLDSSELFSNFSDFNCRNKALTAKRLRQSYRYCKQTASLVINPIILDGYASHFNCTTAIRASDNDGLCVKL